MRCPKCGNPQYGYVEKRERKKIGDKKWQRTNFQTLCKKCGHAAVEAKK